MQDSVKTLNESASTLSSTRDVELNRNAKSNINYLQALDCKFHSSKQEEHLKENLIKIGWRGFITEVQATDLIYVESHRNYIETTRHYDVTDGVRALINYWGEKEKILEYMRTYTYMLFPARERFRWLIQKQDLREKHTFGDVFLKTAWENSTLYSEPQGLIIWDDEVKLRLSPEIYQVDHFPMSDMRGIKFVIRFHYVDSSFNDYLTLPPSLESLDKTISNPENYATSPNIPIDTTESNSGRGERVENIIHDLKKKFPGIEIELEDSIKRILVPLNMSSRILTQFLNKITQMIGAKWEWVGAAKIRIHTA